MYTVKRELPSAIKDSQVNLFSHELSRSFGPIHKYEFDNATVLSNGLAFKSLSLIKISLKHLRLKETPSFKTQSSITLKYLLKRIFKKPIKLETGFWVTDTWSKGYFHWMADALPSIIKFQKEHKHIRVLLPQELIDIPFISTSLSLCEIEYFIIKTKNVYKVKDLYFADHLASTGNYHPETMRLLSASILKKVNTKKRETQRVFISRFKANKRHLINENKLTSILESNKFQSIILEDYSWTDQIAIFIGARVLLGTHGAGLTNMIFMPNNSRVIEIRPKSDKHNNCYFALANVFNHHYQFIEANIIPNPNDHIGDLEINITELELVLSKL